MKYITVRLYPRHLKTGRYYYLRWRKDGWDRAESLGKCPRQWAEKQRNRKEDDLNNPRTVDELKDREWTQATKDYLAWGRQRMLRENTLNGYERSFNKLWQMMPRLRMISDVKAHHIITLMDAARQEFSPDSANFHRRNLGAFFNWCVEQKIIRESPCKGVRRLPSNRKLGIAKPKLISPAEIHKVVILAKGLFLKQPTYKNHRNYTFLEYLRYTGVRLKEASYCDWSDIRFDNEIIEIRSKPDEHWLIKTGDQRDIAIHPHLLSVLREFREKWPKRLPHLFHSMSTRGERITTRRWTHGNLDTVKRLAVAASVQLGERQKGKKTIITSTLNCHHFRHLFRSMLAEARAPDANIDAMLGHSDARTARQYTHPMDLKKTIRMLHYPA